MSARPIAAVAASCAFVLLGCNGTGSAPVAASGPTSDLPLVHPADLVYQGAFRVPEGDAGGEARLGGYSYGGTAIAYDPDRDGLFMVGHDHYQRVGEISIPAPVPADTLEALDAASVIQGLTDVGEGHLADIGEGGEPYTDDSVKIGGLMAWEGRLIGAVYGYYDAASRARSSHFSSGRDLSTQGDFRGMFTVGTQNPGFVGGYMTPIPQAWRATLGGSALTGNCCLSIIARTSFGPTATAFDPSDVGTTDPAPATLLVGYPADHPTLGEWGNTETVDPDFNMGTQVTGIAFPEGTRSVLFFGRQGLGVPCYGAGTDDPSLDRTPIEPGSSVVYCLDRASHSKGTHAYPYASYVWAYDASELALVRAGQKQPWEVQPYATWSLDLPFATEGRNLGGAAYDPLTRRLFLSQECADPGGGYFCGPVIHVFEVR
jgi:hypothetical protein